MDNYIDELQAMYNRSTPKDINENTVSVLRIKDLIEQIPIKPDHSIHLDACTGTSVLPILLQQKYPHLVSHGVDINLPSLMVGKELVKKYNFESSINLYQKNIEELDWYPSIVDIITCSSAIILLQKPQKFIEDCFIILKSGGILAFSTVTWNSFNNELIHQTVRNILGISLPDVKDNLNTLKVCKSVCKNAGFKSISITTKDYSKLEQLENVSWSGTWVHKDNPLRNISDVVKKELENEYSLLATKKAINGKIYVEQKYIYTVAMK